MCARTAVGAVKPLAKRYVYAATVNVFFDKRFYDNVALFDGIFDFFVAVNSHLILACSYFRKIVFVGNVFAVLVPTTEVAAESANRNFGSRHWPRHMLEWRHVTAAS